jgi:predicted  nucleic acid-binding Zn-ribbon protein
MDNLLPRLQATNRKAAKLERLLLRLKQEKHQLLDQIAELNDALEAKEKEYAEMHEKYEALKLAKSIGTGNGTYDKEAVQNMIEDYIKEIDICLKNFGD